jgi:hypothetical protein
MKAPEGASHAAGRPYYRLAFIEGERALRATHTPTAAQGNRLCALVPVNVRCSSGAPPVLLLCSHGFHAFLFAAKRSCN